MRELAAVKRLTTRPYHLRHKTTWTQHNNASSYSARGLSPPSNHQLPMYPLQQECLESDVSDVCEINENLISFCWPNAGLGTWKGQTCVWDSMDCLFVNEIQLVADTFSQLESQVLLT